MTSSQANFVTLPLGKRQWEENSKSYFVLQMRPDNLFYVVLRYDWWPRRKCWLLTSVKVSEVAQRLFRAILFLRITFDRKEIQTWGWSHCIFLVETHRMICSMIYLGDLVTLTKIWPKFKYWPWTFEVKKYIFWLVSARETRWCHRRFSIFFVQKLFAKNYSWHLTFNDLWWPEYWPEWKTKQNNFIWNLSELSIAFSAIFLLIK